MKADARFSGLDPVFWANVRSISETLRYTERPTKKIRVYSPGDMIHVMETLGLEWGHLADQNGNITAFAEKLQDYFKHRAEVLNTYVKPRLMDANRGSQHVRATPIAALTKLSATNEQAEGSHEGAQLLDVYREHARRGWDQRPALRLRS